MVASLLDQFGQPRNGDLASLQLSDRLQPAEYVFRTAWMRLPLTPTASNTFRRRIDNQCRQAALATAPSKAANRPRPGGPLP